jgi:hypothetical protein
MDVVGGGSGLVALVALAAMCAGPGCAAGPDDGGADPPPRAPAAPRIARALSAAPAAASAAPAAACIPGSMTLTVTALDPAAPPTHPAQSTAVYDVAVTDGDAGPCAPRILLFEGETVLPGFTRFVDPAARQALPGETQHFTLSLTGTTDAAPGSYELPVDVLDARSGDTASGAVTYVLEAPAGCFVRPSRELFVSDLSVVEDPARTSLGGPPDDPRTGAWTFARLAERAAPAPERAAELVESLFDTWRDDQTVNGFTVAARPDVEPFLLAPWPRGPDGHLDLARAPLRLLAIVNRIDLRSLASGRAGQGRFVFGVVDAAGFANPFTIILEYRLPAANEEQALSWARAWHRLGELPFPSEAFNAELQRITDRFTARGAFQAGVNGSALDTVRSNEIALGSPWELRQLELGRADGLFHETPVDVTPDISFLDTPTLADFINRFQRIIVAGDLRNVPLRFERAAFRAGSALNTSAPWTAPGIARPEARLAFSLGTCNGCHSISETGTEFVHVKPRDAGQASVLSGFLTGAAVHDPISDELHTFNDLERRKNDLEQLVCRCGRGPCRAAWDEIHRVH